MSDLLRRSGLDGSGHGLSSAPFAVILHQCKMPRAHPTALPAIMAHSPGWHCRNFRHVMVPRRGHQISPSDKPEGHDLRVRSLRQFSVWLALSRHYMFTGTLRDCPGRITDPWMEFSSLIRSDSTLGSIRLSPARTAMLQRLSPGCTVT